jgi:hypothetical protein
MISKLANIADSVVVLVWAFKIRNRMNLILEAEKTSELWFKGFWTFFFQLFYMQFKINKIRAAEPSIDGDGQPAPQC